MVFPLLMISLFWDNYEARRGIPLGRNIVNLKLLRQILSAHSSKLVAGLIFLVMGGVNILVGLTGTMIPVPGSAQVGVLQARLQETLVTAFSGVSLALPTLIGIIAFAFMIILLIGVHFWQGRNVRESARLVWVHNHA
jgi:hypothetical protein